MFVFSVTSSEKVDKAQRYADFTLLSVPYPGIDLHADNILKTISLSFYLFNGNNHYTVAVILVVSCACFQDVNSSGNIKTEITQQKGLSSTGIRSIHKHRKNCFIGSSTETVSVNIIVLSLTITFGCVCIGLCGCSSDNPCLLYKKPQHQLEWISGSQSLSYIFCLLDKQELIEMGKAVYKLIGFK